MEGHQHHAGCGCSEEFKKQDDQGADLFHRIDQSKLECFNERQSRSVLNVIRPIVDRMDFSKGVVQSGYGPDLVVNIPFSGQVRLKAIIVIGGDEGSAPSKMKIYKNEPNVDINIIQDKKPIQVIDMNENVSGELEYLLNVTKFNNTDSVVLGFDENFGAPKTIIKFLGFKGEYLRDKPKITETIYEVQANLKDHKTRDDAMGSAGLGF